MNRKMGKVLVGIIVSLVMSVEVWLLDSAQAATTQVSSHATPALVNEINTSLGEIDAVVVSSTNAILSGTVSFNGVLRTVPTSLNVTNGQVITVAASKYILTGIDNTDGATNTVTLAAPGTANLGGIVSFVGAFTATNAITFPASGVTRIPVGAVLEDADNDTIVFEAFDVSTWTCTSFINNQ